MERVLLAALARFGSRGTDVPFNDLVAGVGLPEPDVGHLVEQAEGHGRVAAVRESGSAYPLVVRLT